MHTTTQTTTCYHPGCGAAISFTVTGPHDLPSTGQVLEDVSKVAGWVDGYCPNHRRTDGARCRLKVELVV